MVYGKDETNRSISNAVKAVLSKYKFTSLPELNAVLQQYNIIADPGKEDGRIYKHDGLIYRVLDEKGFKIGVPIKASSLSTKPTLKNLKKEFEKNGLLRESHKQSLKEKIDSALTKQHGTMQDLIKLLKKEQINVLLRQNAEGRIYGITFIDNKTCCVFNGSDLGKGYSAAALQKSILNPAINIPENSEPRAKSKLQTVASGITKQEGKELTLEKPQAKQSIPELLMSPQPNFSNTPSQLKKKKKKQRRLGL